MKINIGRVIAMMLFMVFMTPYGTLGATGIVSDDFSAPALDTGLWTFVNPLADAELTATGTNIEIAVPAGIPHSPWTGGNLAPGIMQSVSNGDFEIEARFDARMNKAYMTQGIVIEQDANNFLRFEFFSDGTNTRVFAAVLAGSGLPLTPAVKKNLVIGGASSPVPLYMRVKREGDQWTQSYSTDGTTWTQSVSFTYVLNVTAAGPYAGNDGSNPPEFTGSIDYFFNTASPIIPGDGGDSTPPLTDVWYGSNQVFGQHGIPQTLVNILGNVSDPSGTPTLSYSLNGGADLPLSVGPDGLRLASEGDFNIEIAYTDLACSPELNEVEIKATDIFSNTGVETVTVEYICGTTWPETYSIDWSTVSGISDAAQVVDGQWTLGADSIRTTVTGYDRLVAIGDITWDDYEVSVPVTIHSMGADGMVSLVTRWLGHSDQAGGQPWSAWSPLGAIGGYGWFNDAGDYRMRIIGNNLGIIADDKTGLHLAAGGSYIFKMRAETIGSNSIYSLKVWEEGTAEPEGWNLRGIGLSGELKQGSAMLLAHKSDVSFGNVTIVPGPFADDTTPPVISDIISTPDAFSATVSWTTDEPSTGRVEYGLTQDYEMGSVPSDSLASSHSVTVVGLAPETLYHIRVVSVDPYGNSSNSPDETFVSTTNQSNIVSDDFNSCSLNSGVWSFVNPLGDATLTMTGTNLQISVPAGTAHDLYVTKNAPRVMQSADDTDFLIEVKYDALMTGQYQMQGVIVEQDFNSNFIRFDFYSSTTGTYIFATTFTTGTPGVPKFNLKIGNNPGPSQLFMRINRQGDLWVVTYSLDGTTWLLAGSFHHVLTVASAGVFVGTSGTNPAFTGSIDYFFNTASRITPEDGNTMPVTVNIAGEGTVAKNPDKTSYSCSDVVELTPLPATDWSFDGWSGDCSGTGACSVTIDGPKTVNATFFLTHVNTTTTITTASPDPSVPGQTVTIGFSVDANVYDHLIPTGSVTVDDGEGKTCTGQLDAGGNGSCSIAWTTSGSRNLIATYAGSGIFASSTSAAVSHMVTKVDQVISFDVIGDKTYGDAPFIVAATGGASGNPVTFTIVSGPATATGENGSTITLTGAGSVTVRASQAGNEDHNAAPDVDRTFTVNKANQKITVTSSAPVNASYNSSFTVSATAGSGLAVVISTSGTCSGSGESSATVTMTSDSGTCTVSYNQTGDSNYNAAPEVTQITNAKMAVPAVPVSLSVKVLNENSVRLVWTDASDNEAGFKIEQREDGGAYINIAFAGAGTKSRTLYERTPGATYTYRVRAYNAGGNSEYSNEAVAALMKPNAPSQLMARATSDSEIVIVWQDNSVLETEFILQRKKGKCASANPWEAAGYPPADTEEYTDTGLQANTVYSYRIKASNSYGESANSACGTSILTGKTGTPASPTNLNAEAVDYKNIHLSWDDNSIVETSFRVYRSTSTVSTWDLYATTEPDITEFIDDSAAGNKTTTTYLYYVKACNSIGCSPASAVAGVPHAPTGFSAVPDATAGISVTWLPADDGPSGYIVYRKRGWCKSGNLWEELTTLPVEATSFHDDSVVSGVKYSYLSVGFLISDYHPVAYGYSLESSCVSVLAP